MKRIEAPDWSRWTGPCNEQYWDSRLTDVLRWVGNLTKLEELYLLNNNIQVFPLQLVEWLVAHPHTEVYLGDNPLRVPPQEVWDQGPGAVKDYYNSLTQSSELSLRTHVYELL